VREYVWDPMKWRFADPAARGRRHGRGAEMGGRLHTRSVGRLRLSQAAAGPRSNGGDSRQCHGWGKTLSAVRYACSFRNMPGNWRRQPQFRRRLPEAVRHDIYAPSCTIACRIRLARNHGRHDARRVGQLHCRPHCQPLQLPRTQLRMRCRVCASAMAAISSAVEGLIQNDFDVAVSGGIDRNMGAPTFR
jgi:hypothetical protein